MSMFGKCHAYQDACKSHVESSGLQQERICSVLILAKNDRVLKLAQVFSAKYINDSTYLNLFTSGCLYTYIYVRVYYMFVLIKYMCVCLLNVYIYI